MSRGWKIALAAVFYALLVVFLFRYLRGTDWSQLARLEFSPLYLLAAVPFSIGSRMLQPVAWAILIRAYGDQPPPYAQITRVYATSWMGRYIPGKVAWIGAKVLFGREYGIRASTLAATSIAEAALHLTTALALGFVLIALWGNELVLGEDVRLLAIIAMAAMVILLAPPVFNRATAWARSLAGAPPAPDAKGVSFAALAVSGVLCVIIHALSGPSIYFVLKSMYSGIAATLIPELTAAVLIAGTLGTLALFAPAGLGVREGILIVLIGLLIPRSVAVAGVVVLRLWSIVMDLLYYLVGVLLDRIRPMRAPVTSHQSRTPA
jgi:glycosyltransferase 2 family protein